MKNELFAIFEGKVQGVGFRATAKVYASRYALTGYVKNLPNGSVELCAQGEKRTLENLLQSLEREFPLSRPVQIVWKEVPISYDTFRIAY